VRLELDAGGVDVVVADFLALRNRFEDPAPVLETDVAYYLRGRQGRRFATRGDGTWRRDKPSTVRRKGNAQVGRDSGDMIASFTRSRAKGSVARARGGTLTFGTSLYWARFFTRERPLFHTKDSDERAVAARVLRWLIGGLR
jgi:hypothetical protein